VHGLLEDPVHVCIVGAFRDGVSDSR